MEYCVNDRSHVPVMVTAAAFALGFAVLAGFGLATVWVSPDTASYVAAEGLGEPRLPLYGWLLGVVPHAVLPAVQWGLFAAASCLLVAALQAVAGRAAGLAVGLALAGSNLVLLWGNALLPELAGHAALLAAFAAVLQLAGRGGWGWIVAAGGGVSLAWALRPALLGFVVLIPVLLLLLAPARRRLAAWLAVACLMPALLLGAVRLARVGDANVVSFGGFQMAGMAALMLTPAVIDRLPAEVAPVGRAILTRRAALEAAGKAIAVPENSRGERSFVSVAVFYFDLLARTHDDVLYGAVLPERGAAETWVAFNARMQRFAVAVVRAAPIAYLAWLAGASARLVGHALVLNPAFMLAAALCLVSRRCAGPGRVLWTVVGVYTGGVSVMLVAVTFPASRYIDSAALLLAALPLAGWIAAMWPRLNAPWSRT